MANRTEIQKKYDLDHTTRINLKLNNQTDADILTWLKQQDSMQGSIKSLIRAAAAKTETEERERPNRYIVTYKLTDKAAGKIARYAERTDQTPEQALQQIMVALVQPKIDERLPMLKHDLGHRDAFPDEINEYKVTFHLTDDQERILERLALDKNLSTWRTFEQLTHYFSFTDKENCARYAELSNSSGVNLLK